MIEASIDCTSKVDNAQINYAKDQDIKNSNNYSKTLGSLS